MNSFNYSYKNNNKTKINDPYDFELRIYDDDNIKTGSVMVHRSVIKKILYMNLENIDNIGGIDFSDKYITDSILKKIINFYYNGHIEFDNIVDVLKCYTFCYINRFNELGHVLMDLVDIDKIIKYDNLDNLYNFIIGVINDENLSYDKRADTKFLYDIGYLINEKLN